MDVGDDTTASDCSLDETIKLLITTDSKLEMPWSDTLDFEVFAGVTRELENFCSEVLEDGGRIDGRSGTDALLAADAVLEMAVDTADGELKAGARGTRDDFLRIGGLGLVGGRRSVLLFVCGGGGGLLL